MVKAIRVNWTEGVSGRVIYHPYSNIPVTSYALVSPKQLARMKAKRGSYMNLRVLDQNVPIGRDTPLFKGEGGF